MSISKFVLNGVTQMDLTDTTATAADVALGKLFYDAAGVKTEGTGSGGGSGFGSEYEEGIYTPSSNVAEPIINFARTHSTTPVLVTLIDVTGDMTDVSMNTNISCVYFDPYRLYGVKFPGSTTALTGCMLTYFSYRSSSSIVDSGWHTTYSYEDPTDSDVYYTRYWVTESGFKASTRGTSRYWRSGRTYKWFAIWA